MTIKLAKMRQFSLGKFMVERWDGDEKATLHVTSEMLGVSMLVPWVTLSLQDRLHLIEILIAIDKSEKG
jgi:hypothetical protein